MRSVAAVFCLLAPASPLAPVLPASPVAIVEYLYAHPDSIYTRNQAALSAAFFAPRLISLYRKDQEDNKGYVPNLDFDFLSNSQDPSVTQVKVSPDARENRKDRRTVVVHFLNNGAPEIEVFTFECEKRRWLICEVQCTTPGRTWILSKILEGHPK